METKIQGKLARKLEGRPPDVQEQIIACIELIGSDLVRAVVDKLQDPEEFLRSIVDTRAPQEKLKAAQLISGGKVNPIWTRIFNAIEPHLIFSALDLNPEIWKDSGLSTLRRLSTLDRVSFLELATLIEDQTKFAPKEAIFKIWGKREPSVDQVLFLTDYLENTKDLTFATFILPRLSGQVLIQDAVNLDTDSDPNLLATLSNLPKERGGKVYEIKSIDELRSLLELSRPIEFRSDEAKEWCLNVALPSALRAYGKLPSRRTILELAKSLEIIFENGADHILGENPKRFFQCLGQTVVRGLRLISYELRRARDIKSFEFARMVEETLRPFFSGIDWQKTPSIRQKDRALWFYVAGLNINSEFIKLAGASALNYLLRSKKIFDITDNQFKKLYLKHVEAFKKLEIDPNNFKWKEAYYPLLVDNNNWLAKKVALNEILTFYAPNQEFTQKAIDLALRYPSIKGVKDIVESYQERSLEIIEAVYNQKEHHHLKLISAIAQAKPKNIRDFIKNLISLNGATFHPSWRLDEERADLEILKIGADSISGEEGAKLAKIVSPLHPEYFARGYLSWGESKFERAFRLFKVVVGDEKKLSELLELIPNQETELDLFLNWFSKQNYAARREFVENLLSGKKDRVWETAKILATPFGLLKPTPEIIVLGERVPVGTLQLYDAKGVGGIEYIRQWFRDFKEDLSKPIKTHREELIIRLSKAKNSECDPVTDLETIASHGKRLKDDNKIDLIAAVLNLAPLWGDITDYDLALMSESEVRGVLEEKGLYETARFAHKINESAKERHARQLLREIEFYKKFFETKKPEVENHETPDEGLVDRLNRRYAPVAERQEFNNLRLQRLMSYKTEDNDMTQYIIYAFAQNTRDHKSLHDLKNQLKALVSNQSENLKEALTQRLFLEYTPKENDIDESVKHLAEIAWEVRLREYDTIEEILDVGLEGTDLLLETLGTRLISAYPEIRLLLDSEHPLLVKEALKWVGEVIEEVPELTPNPPPNYKSSRLSFSIGLRKVKDKLDIMIGSFEEPDSYGALTANTPLGEKLLGFVALKGDRIVGITPTVTLLYSGKIPGSPHRRLKDEFEKLKQSIF